MSEVVRVIKSGTLLQNFFSYSVVVSLYSVGFPMG